MREIVIVRASEIIIDEASNCRHPEGSAALIARAEEPGAELSDLELVDSVRRHGIIHPILVQEIGPERYKVLAGTRRLKAALAVDPEMEIICTVLKSTGDPERDELVARSINLAENVHRRGLKPFEIAAALWRLHQQYPDLPVSDLASEVGFSSGYCYQLIGIARDACPELWELFRRFGYKMPGGIGWKDLLAVVRHPKHEQIAAWQKIVSEQCTGAGQQRAKPQRASTRQLRKYLRQLADVPGDEQYRLGLRYGLLVALGRQSWVLEQQNAPAAEQSEEQEFSNAESI